MPTRKTRKRPEDESKPRSPSTDGTTPTLGAMVFPAPPADEAERFIQDNDLDVLEISLPISPGPLPAETRRNVEALGRHLPGGVQLHEILPLVLAHREASFRRRIVERLKDDIRLARSAGVRLLTLHTTCTRTRRPLRDDWQQEKTRWMARTLDLDVTTSYDESVNVLAQALRELHRVADPSRGPRVTLAVENNFRDTRYFRRRIDSVEDVLGIIDRLDLPCVRMCFDIFKAYSTEASVPGAIRRAAGRIANMHASDAEPADTAFFRKRAPVGEGAIAWDEVAGAISEIGYRGAIILEMMRSTDDLRTSARRLRGLLAAEGDAG